MAAGFASPTGASKIGAMSEDDFRDSIQLVGRRVLCTFPRCNLLISNGTRCTAHQKKRSETHGSTRWKKASIAWRLEHPFCAICGAHAEHVDHIEPHHGNTQLFWQAVARGHLESLCATCHRSKSAP